MIVFPCRYDSERPVIFRAVETARAHMPNERILVVDSDSPDKTYLDRVQQMGAIPACIANRHYETGALWYAYRKYPDESFFYLLHDSTEILKDLSPLRRHPVSAFQGLKNWDRTTMAHWEWADQVMMATDIPQLRSGFWMLMGCMQFVHSSLLRVLAHLRFDLVLPTTKPESQAMERLWGVAYAHLGYPDPPMIRDQWAWDKTDHGIRSDYLVKYLLHRS